MIRTVWPFLILWIEGRGATLPPLTVTLISTASEVGDTEGAAAAEEEAEGAALVGVSSASPPQAAARARAMTGTISRARNMKRNSRDKGGLPRQCRSRSLMIR